jgi:FAD/FMN-containing dehydrogenase
MTPSPAHPMVRTPSTEEEVADLLREASAEGRPVTVLRGDGSGTHAHPGDTPDSRSDTLSISLEGLDRVHEHEPADLTVTVGAGLRLQRLAHHLQEAGQWIPVDPPGGEARRVGGLVAGGRWGPLHLGYGAPRDHVLGATLVTGDGRILALGGKVVKNVAGFDLLRLAVGSRGSLGVVVRATVRLHPLPAADRTLLFPSPDHRDLHILALRLAGLPGSPAALEVLGPGRLSGTGLDGLSPGGGAVALRLMGTPGGVEALSLLAEATASIPPAVVLSDSASRGFFQSLTDGMDGGRPWVRLSVLPSHLPELVRRLSPQLELLDRAPEGWWATHVRAGVIRLSLPTDPSEGMPGAPDLLEAVGAWATSVGGGYRRGGDPTLPGQESPPRIHRLQEGIRRVFDPAGVMRPLPQWHP